MFAAIVRFSFNGAIMDTVSEKLAREEPDLSARSGANRAQKLVAGFLALAGVAGVLFGGPLWSTVCAAFGFCMFLAVVLRLQAAVSTCARAALPAPVLSDADLPTYTILIALYREAAVAPRLVAALAAIDYPVVKLQIIFALEADDHATQDALQAQALPPHASLLLVPEGKPRTKPRALNYGLLAARGSLLVIFDAEDQPEPDQLRKGAAAFAAAPSNVACLQASLSIDNLRDSWLTRLFALDYSGLFDVFNPGLARLDVPVPLGGTSNHFRTDILRRIGGWDAWNVTEDADLGLRLARFGFSTQVIDSTTWEEAPATLRHWFPQRRRWMKGWMQTLVTHTRQPRRLAREIGWMRAVLVIATLGANTLGPLIGPIFMAYVTFDAIAGDLLSPQKSVSQAIASTCWIMLATTGLVSLILPTALAMSRRGLWSSAFFLLARPFHWALMSAAAWSALFDLFRRPFHWAKTEHGISQNKLRKFHPPKRA
ncbi:MAG: glycosyltransferase [Hyphomicrobiales bacterium]|nr:glycosyltransferase [Hyphomicrobiales bacterium]